MRGATTFDPFQEHSQHVGQQCPAGGYWLSPNLCERNSPVVDAPTSNWATINSTVSRKTVARERALEAGTIAGRWWVPGVSRRARHGRLELDEGVGTQLTLHGELVRSDGYPSYPVIVGRTALGEEITLIDCTARALTCGTARAGMNAEESIRCASVVRGRHIRRPDGARWDSAVFTFDNLDASARAARSCSIVPAESIRTERSGRRFGWRLCRALKVSIPSGDVEIGQGHKVDYGVDN